MNSFNETKNLFNNSNFFYIITTNMEGKYTYVNNRYKRVFESIHGKIVDQPYHVTIHPDDTEICVKVSAQCFEYPDKVFPATIRKHDGKGGFLVTQWEYKAILDDEGLPAGIFCMGYDITEFQNTSNQLETALQTVGEKESILTRIAYHQSHIIRKPVANILGLGLVLESTPMDNNLQSLISLIVDSARELDVAIKDIADQSQTVIADQRNN